MAYYAEHALSKVRTCLLERKWWDFLEKDLTKKTLLEAMVLVSQWLEVPNEYFPSLLDIKDFLSKLTLRVKKLVIEKQRSYRPSGAFTAKQEMSPRDVLAIINHVLFHESEKDYVDTMWLQKEYDFNEQIKNISITKVDFLYLEILNFLMFSVFLF